MINNLLMNSQWILKWNNMLCVVQIIELISRNCIILIDIADKYLHSLYVWFNSYHSISKKFKTFWSYRFSNLRYIYKYYLKYEWIVLVWRPLTSIKSNWRIVHIHSSIKYTIWYPSWLQFNTKSEYNSIIQSWKLLRQF